jgi:hypothetical protein
MQLDERTEPTMSPLDVPGQVQITSLFPWLAQLVPAAETSPRDASPAPLAPRPPAIDLPHAA